MGRISAYEAYAAWAHFLTERTLAGPITCYFALPDVPELTVEPRVRAKIGEIFPASGERHPVLAERVNEAIDLLATLEPQPTNRWGSAPVWLVFECDFALKGPDGRVWPSQHTATFGSFQTLTGVRLGASSTNLSLHAKRTMGLLLSVPDATDADLTDLIPWLQSALPFRLSRKHWSRWTLAKNGRTYRGRRLNL